MGKETIVVASDHAGVRYKDILKEDLRQMGYEVLDLGTHGPDPVDYPDYAHALAEAIAAGKARRGVLVCGSGLGVGIAANRHPGIRAAVCHDALTARLARAHTDANVLALGERVIGIEEARDCLRVFLSTDFEGGRHARRVAKLG